MGHDLAIIVMQNLLFIGSYGIDTNVIHLHHKLNGSQFGNNSRAKSAFHGSVWNKHECHSSTCVV
jgi:hypothetical protein